MKITCSNCNSIFNVSEKYLGRKVKCPKCNISFLAEPTVEVEGTHEVNMINHDTLTNNSINLKSSKQDSWADPILRSAFSVANGISAIVVLISVIACIIFLAIFILSKPQKKNISPFESPKFSEFLKEQQARNNKTIDTKKNHTELTQDQSNMEYINPFEHKYGILLNDLCSKYNLQRDILSKWLEEIDEEYRNNFLPSLQNYFTDAENHFTANGTKRSSINFQKGAYNFYENYREAIAEHKYYTQDILEYNTNQRNIATTRKHFCLIALLISAGSLLLFLIYPLLIQIEKNTRGEIREIKR